MNAAAVKPNIRKLKAFLTPFAAMRTPALSRP